jgi:hypothetical protein
MNSNVGISGKLTMHDGKEPAGDFLRDPENFINLQPSVRQKRPNQPTG